MGDAVPVDGFERLAALTARLASTAKLEEIVDAVLGQLLDLGFGAVWMAVLDETTGNLITLKEVIDGVDTTHEMPPVFALDMRQPVGHGFRERRMVNIHEPDSLFIMEGFDDVVPDGRLALPRVIYDHMRGHPFACGPLLGSRGQPVGALGLSSYRGREPIPDALFTTGLLRAFMDHLGIAMERALHV
ncbi:MAG TPA: GAF domain-containing protein, partial [Kofleriaceae bacterium]